MLMNYRRATSDDVPFLATLLGQLIEDEGGPAGVALPELEALARDYLGRGYQAIIFTDEAGFAAYALYRQDADGIYLRHFFVDRQHRRRGVGRRAIHTLLSEICPPGQQITVEVLIGNRAGHAFWQALGFRDLTVGLVLDQQGGPAAVDSRAADETAAGNSRGDPRICVAILDGPVDLAHPCFKDAQLTSIPTLVSGQAASGGIASQHGTHVASVIFGQPDTSVLGIAPGCRGLILPVFSDGRGGAEISCSQTDLARAITQAVQQGAHIINISGGQITPAGQAHPLLADAVRLCAENNILVIAAAGNDGCDCLHVPAALPSVLVVGAMDGQGQPFEFSNWGSAYRARGVLAPGEHIPGAVPGGGVAARSGTSFATPIVSGLAALLLSIQAQRGDPPDPRAIGQAILAGASADAVAQQGERLLRGRLNVTGSLAHVMRSNTVVAAGTAHAAPRAPDVPRINLVERSHSVPELSDGRAAPIQNDQGDGLLQDLLSGGNEQPPAQGPQVRPQEAQVPPPAAPVAPAQCARLETGAPRGSAMLPSPQASRVTPSQTDAGSLVYALGTLGYDFGTAARRDWFSMAMRGTEIPPVPEDTQGMLSYLGSERGTIAAEALIWTLNLDATPIYAIRPAGTFAERTYARLVEFLGSQTKAAQALGGGYTRVAVPGVIQGSTVLKSGQVVPVIVPELRGLEQVRPAMELGSWGTEDSTARSRRNNMLFRLFYELRNFGVAPQDRAKNALTVYNLVAIVSAQNELEIDSIQVEKSPIGRPHSDCWDVVLTLFDPTDRLSKARRVFRLTMDVVDVIPVQISEMLEFSVF